LVKKATIQLSVGWWLFFWTSRKVSKGNPNDD